MNKNRALGAVVAVLLSTLVVGCESESSQSAAPSAAQTDVPPPLVPAMPLPQNAVDDAVAKLDGIAEDLMDKSGIPGMSVAVVHQGNTVYAKGFGVKDAGGATDENRVDADTVFQLASLSKPLAATVVAHQVGVNAVDWNTPIVAELPWFALSDPAVTRMVTVGDMLAHRSGLPDHAGDKLEDLGYDRRQVLERLVQLPLDPFRISYAYTNFGFTAGAEAVAANAGKPWEQLADEVLFAPLGMSSTSYRFADYQARPNRALGHIHVDGRYQPTYVRDADPEAPAGGASASANDMTRWLAMVLANGTHDGKQIIDAKALLPALTPQSVSSRATEPAMRSGFYGYGFNVNSTSGARMELSHSGAFLLGAGTNFVILPSADVGIVVLTNGSPSGVPEALTAEFADLVQFGEVREDWYQLYSEAFAEMIEPQGTLVGEQQPPNPAPAAPLASYVGTYHNDYWGPARITEVDGQLRLTLGTKLNVPLAHWDGDRFTYSWVSENSPPGSVSTVTFGGDKLTIEDYDEFGNGVFAR
ncbi:serine hydrolase [Mycolicibacterium sp. XJ662]